MSKTNETTTPAVIDTTVTKSLLNAFQDSGAKESILKVQGTGGTAHFTDPSPSPYLLTQLQTVSSLT